MREGLLARSFEPIADRLDADQSARLAGAVVDDAPETDGRRLSANAGTEASARRQTGRTARRRPTMTRDPGDERQRETWMQSADECWQLAVERRATATDRATPLRYAPAAPKPRRGLVP
jgi:hypothetical protein